VTSDALPHEEITVASNTIINGGIRVSNAINVNVTHNTIENGSISIDAGAGRPIHVQIDANRIVSNNTVAIGFYGARDSSATNNVIQMRPPENNESQTGIAAAIWGTSLIENNTISDSTGYGLTFANWGLGGGNSITICGNTFEGFGKVGIWDQGKHVETVVLLNNVFYSEEQAALWAILVENNANIWSIKHNACRVKGLTGTAAINATKSILSSNYAYSK